MSDDDRITAGPIETIISPDILFRQSYVIFREGIQSEDGLARIIVEYPSACMGVVKSSSRPDEISLLTQVQMFLQEHDAYLAHAHCCNESISGDCYYRKRLPR